MSTIGLSMMLSDSGLGAAAGYNRALILFRDFDGCGKVRVESRHEGLRIPLSGTARPVLLPNGTQWATTAACRGEGSRTDQQHLLHPCCLVTTRRRTIASRRRVASHPSCRGQQYLSLSTRWAGDLGGPVRTRRRARRGLTAVRTATPSAGGVSAAGT
jgi:hypothetical protein